MISFTCDMCGKPLLADENVRYVVKVEVFAAYDPMEIVEQDLEQDYLQQISDLMEDVEDVDAEELEEDVYKAFRFDLCPACQKKYIADPLFRKARGRIRFSEN